MRPGDSKFAGGVSCRWAAQQAVVVTASVASQSHPFAEKAGGERLVLRPARHQLFHGGAGDATVEYAVTARVGISMPSSAARWATSARREHLPRHAPVRRQFRQGLPPARSRPTTIARKLASAGQDQIAHAGQSREGFTSGAERSPNRGSPPARVIRQRER